jgi:AcrR family transcriptional regulator/DNA-binding MarR family transcriptional regulator
VSPRARVPIAAAPPALSLGQRPDGRARSQSDVRLAEIQRSRLIAAAVRTIAELGYTRATVAHITNQARVSRRTFYELFANREDCMVAVLDQVVRLVSAEIDAAGLDGLPWRERVRGGLWAILCFFDREPVFAQVCLVQSSRGGATVLARRQEILDRLVAAIDEGRRERSRGRECSPLTAEGLVGAALAIAHARLSRGAREPLSALLGELMSMIALPYLGSAVARREQTRPAPAATPVGGDGKQEEGRHAAADPLLGLSMRLTYRTIRVLQSIAEHPGASNRQTALHAGISDPGQVSKLLARLQANGLLDNSGAGHLNGEPNEWRLTAKGQRVAQGIRLDSRASREAA